MRNNINKFGKSMKVPRGNAQNKGKPVKDIKPYNKGGKT